MKHSCKDMRLFLENPQDPILYNIIFREYYIKLYKQPNIITFSYCPWCGKVLPQSLRKEFFETLESEYDIVTDIGEYKKNKRIPPEFKTDEWWKKRGL